MSFDRSQIVELHTFLKGDAEMGTVFEKVAE